MCWGIDQCHLTKGWENSIYKVAVAWITFDISFLFFTKEQVSALSKENEKLREEAAKLKRELTYWEIRNGSK